MACFVVPATEAIVTTVATKIIEKREQKNIENNLENGVALSELNKAKLSDSLKRLNGMLWGGSALLAFEHVWHGEVQPFFPFLTAASNPVDFSEMLHEMSTVGVSMAVLVTGVWAASIAVTSWLDKKEKSAVVSNK